MKGTTVSTWVMLALLFSSCGSIGELFSLQPNVEGIWYFGGARDKVTSIDSVGNGLEARNESGQVSRLQWDGARTLVALDWGGLQGDYSNDRIQWANGTFWVRDNNSGTARPSQINGVWYFDGLRDRVAHIDGLEATNENGSVSRLRWEGSNTVVALDWGGLRGDVRNDRIQWANGNSWLRDARR
jgi:hypothetical protein